MLKNIDGKRCSFENLAVILYFPKVSTDREGAAVQLTGMPCYAHIVFILCSYYAHIMLILCSYYVQTLWARMCPMKQRMMLFNVDSNCCASGPIAIKNS